MHEPPRAATPTLIRAIGRWSTKVFVIVRYTYASHLECSVTAERSDIGTAADLSAAGQAAALARYDLAALRREVQREVIEARAPGLWRWQELLPVTAPDHIVSLGEVETPLIPAHQQSAPARILPARRQGRGPAAHRLLQVARPVSGRFHGQVLPALSASPFPPTATPVPAIGLQRAGLSLPDDTPGNQLLSRFKWLMNGLINGKAPEPRKAPAMQPMTCIAQKALSRMGAQARNPTHLAAI